MRISIIGHSAAGKSTLARRISEKFHIPRLHIDKFWFETGGHRLPLGDTAAQEKARAHVLERTREFVQKDSWVSDGWYPRIQPVVVSRADQIIFLDVPLWRRISNHIWRTLSGKSHKEFTLWHEIRFIPQIIYRTYHRDGKMRQFMKENAEKVLVLKSFREVEQYLRNLE